MSVIFRVDVLLARMACLACHPIQPFGRSAASTPVLRHGLQSRSARPRPLPRRSVVVRMRARARSAEAGADLAPRRALKVLLDPFDRVLENSPSTSWSVTLQPPRAKT